MKPDANPIALLRALRERKRRAISYGELGRRAKMSICTDTSALYVGYALKAA